MEQTRKPTILIADDQTAIREMLAEHIATSGIGIPLACTPCDRLLVDALCTHNPDILVCDPSPQGVLAPGLMQCCLKVRPRLRILLFSSRMRPGRGAALLGSGIHGLMEKSEPLSELGPSLHALASGGARFPRRMRSLMRSGMQAKSPGSGTLSPREVEVLQMVVSSYTTRAIAGAFGISMKTVENHRYSIMKKLNIHNIAGLVHFSLQNRDSLPGML